MSSFIAIEKTRGYGAGGKERAMDLVRFQFVQTARLAVLYSTGDIRDAKTRWAFVITVKNGGKHLIHGKVIAPGSTW